MTSGCPFCDYQGPSPVLWWDGDTFFFEPLNPVTPGHVLAVPLAHVEDAVTFPVLTGMVMASAARYIGEFGVAPANIITSIGAAASQTVMHFHVHVVPRREGDGLLLPWS